MMIPAKAGGKAVQGLAGVDFIFRKRAKAFTMPKRSYIISTAKEQVGAIRQRFASMLEGIVREMGK